MRLSVCWGVGSFWIAAALLAALTHWQHGDLGDPPLDTGDHLRWGAGGANSRAKSSMSVSGCAYACECLLQAQLPTNAPSSPQVHTAALNPTPCH